MNQKGIKVSKILVIAIATAILSIPLYSYAIDYTATGSSNGSSIDYTADGNTSSGSQVFTTEQGGLQKVIKLPKADDVKTQNTAQDLTQPQDETQNAALSAPTGNETVEEEKEVCTNEDLAALEKANEKIMDYSKNAEAAYNLALNMNAKAETSLVSGDISDFRSSVEGNSALVLDEDFNNSIKLYKKCNQSPPLTAFAPAPVQIISIFGLDSF